MKMISVRITLRLLSTTLLVGGCTQVAVQSVRDTRTLLEPQDTVAIAVCDEATDLAANAEDCVAKALKEAFPTLRIISSEAFYRTAFPEPAAEKTVHTGADISSALKDPAFRERIAPLGLRYLILIRGGTEQTVEPIIGAGAGYGGAVTVLGAEWDRASSLNASIVDLKKYGSVGSLWVTASGKPWFICIGMGPFCAPLGAPAFTESKACGSFGEGVAKFFKGEELPPPLWIVLAPNLPASSIKIGAGEKLFLRVIDQRREDALGLHDKTRKIRSSESLRQVIEHGLRGGLSNRGFEVLESPVLSLPNLEFAIENFEYWGAYYANVDAQVKARLYKRGESAFEKNYEIRNNFDKPFSSPDAGWIQEKINITLSDLLFQILADKELLASLKQQELEME